MNILKKLIILSLGFLLISSFMAIKSTYSNDISNPRSFKKIKDAVIPIDVIEVNSSLTFRDIMHGSGFIIDNKNGYIITAYHVVSEGLKKNPDPRKKYRITAVLPNSSGVIFVSAIKVDIKHDLVILKFTDFDSSSLPKLKLAKDIYEGEQIYAIGFPLFYNFMVTHGIISGLHKQVRVVSGIRNDVFLSDILVNIGNSGGPVINNKGEVVGIILFTIPTAGYSGGTTIEYIREFVKDYVK